MIPILKIEVDPLNTTGIWLPVAIEEVAPDVETLAGRGDLPIEPVELELADRMFEEGEGIPVAPLIIEDEVESDQGAGGAVVFDIDVEVVCGCRITGIEIAKGGGITEELRQCIADESPFQVDIWGGAGIDQGDPEIVSIPWTRGVIIIPSSTVVIDREASYLYRHGK